MAPRTYTTEAVVLRSLRLGEADRVLHLYTLDRGRVGAVAKGVRKTKSRFGARLEPLSHVEVLLHQGQGDLQTVTGVQLLHAHHHAREDYYRLSVGLIGAEAMLRLFSEQEANERAFTALTRFLDALDDASLVGYSPRAGGAVCGACAGQAEALALSPDGIRGIEALLASPLADAGSVGLTDRGARDALRVVTASYEYHGGFRLRTLSA